MLYLKNDDGSLRIVVLETANIEAIKQGRPAKTADGEVLIAWTPDPEWLAKQILESNGDSKLIAKAIDDGSKRPQKEVRHPFQSEHHKL